MTSLSARAHTLLQSAHRILAEVGTVVNRMHVFADGIHRVGDDDPGRRRRRSAWAALSPGQTWRPAAADAAADDALWGPLPTLEDVTAWLQTLEDVQQLGRALDRPLGSDEDPVGDACVDEAAEVQDRLRHALEALAVLVAEVRAACR